MIRTLSFTLVLLAAPAVAQTIAPAPSVEEGRAPRPPRAPGIPTTLAVEAAQAALASCTASGLKVTALVADSVGAPIVLMSADGGAAAAQTPPPPDPTHITLQTLKDLTFEGNSGETRAKLYGDPEKPGPYGIIYKWEPGHHSKPHFHAFDRYGYVISGTWWMSSSDREDPSTLYPAPAGTFVVHKAGQIHWDGGVDSIAYVLVTGIGPIDTTRPPAK